MNDAIPKLQASEERAEQVRIQIEERQAQRKAQLRHSKEISTLSRISGRELAPVGDRFVG